MHERQVIIVQKTKELEAESEKDEWYVYENDDELAYYDKKHHLLRSINNQKNHLQAVKKKKLLQETVEPTL